MGMHETKVLLICLAACPFAAVAKIVEKMFDARSAPSLVEGPAQIGYDENMDASRFDDAHGLHDGANRIAEMFDYVGGNHEIESITGNSGKGLRIYAANLWWMSARRRILIRDRGFVNIAVDNLDPWRDRERARASTNFNSAAATEELRRDLGTVFSTWAGGSSLVVFIISGID
jgi:hypothetical protein